MPAGLRHARAAREQQRLLQAQQIHLRDVPLADSRAGDAHLRAIAVELLSRGRNAHDLRRTNEFYLAADCFHQ